MREGIHSREGVGVGGQEVRPICKDVKQEPLCHSVVMEGSDPRAGGREPFDKREASLCQGDPVGEVVLRVQCRREPVAEPSDYLRGAENEAVQGEGSP